MTKQISNEEWRKQHFIPLCDFLESKGKINADRFCDNFEARCHEIMHSLITEIDPDISHFGGGQSPDVWAMDYANTVCDIYEQVMESKWFPKAVRRYENGETTKTKKGKK